MYIYQKSVKFSLCQNIACFRLQEKVTHNTSNLNECIARPVTSVRGMNFALSYPKIVVAYSLKYS